VKKAGVAILTVTGFAVAAYLTWVQILTGSTILEKSVEAGQGMLGPITLDPGQNPLRILAHVRYRPPFMKSAVFTCTALVRDSAGAEIWRSKPRRLGRSWFDVLFSHSRSRRTTSTFSRIERDTESLGVFHVPKKDAYRIEYRFEDRNKALKSASIRVAANVKEIHPWLVAAFAAPGALLGAGLCFWGWSRSRRPVLEAEPVDL